MNFTTQFDVVIVSLSALVVAGAIIKYLYRLYKKISLKSLSIPLEKNPNIPKIRKSSENYKEALLIISEGGEVMFSNQASAEMLGLSPGFDAFSLRSITPLKLDNGKEIGIFDFLKIYKTNLNQAKEFSARVKLLTPKGEIPIKIFLAAADKTPPCIVVALSDLTAEIEVIASRNKYYLTMLPNQNKAIYDIGMMMSKMHSQDRSFILALLSIDDFTEMRAMLGHQLTDELIIKIADHLKYIVAKKEGAIYHMMRNQFLLMLPDIHTGDHARSAIEEMKKGLKELFGYSRAKMPLTFSTGISIFPRSGKSVDILIDTAYKALSEAEQHGGNYVVVDEEGVFAKSKYYEAELYSEMLDAIENNEFELYYQPLVVMANELVWGAEVLVRWNHPKRGIVSPGLFIPVAEKTGLIIELSRFIIEEAIKQQKKWEIFKFNRLQLSINLSLREIEDGNVVDFIEQTLTKHQVSPGLLKFEITENVAMTNVQASKREFERLKKIGVQLALDDFGTGYSSFEYLKDFSLDTLKIDRAFVKDMVHNTEHQKIVKAMIELGHNFDLQITAEGIEDKKTYDMLKEFGCDIAQGYYFSKPLPVHEFQELIRRKSK